MPLRTSFGRGARLRRRAAYFAFLASSLAGLAAAKAEPLATSRSDSGLRYGADVSIAAIADRDRSTWAAGPLVRLGYAFDENFALYTSVIGLVGPYFRVGALAAFEITAPDAVRFAIGGGVTDTPRIQLLCSEQPCGPDGFFCFDPCEHNKASFTGSLRVAPMLPIPTDPRAKLFSLAFELQLDVAPADGEVRGVSMMSFAFDDVVR